MGVNCSPAFHVEGTKSGHWYSPTTLAYTLGFRLQNFTISSLAVVSSVRVSGGAETSYTLEEMINKTGEY